MGYIYYTFLLYFIVAYTILFFALVNFFVTFWQSNREFNSAYFYFNYE